VWFWHRVPSGNVQNRSQIAIQNPSQLLLFWHRTPIGISKTLANLLQGKTHKTPQQRYQSMHAETPQESDGSSQVIDRPDVMLPSSDCNDEEKEQPTDDKYSLRIYDLARYMHRNASNIDDEKLYTMVYHNTKKMMKESLLWCLSAITEPTAVLVARGACDTAIMNNEFLEKFIDRFRGNDKYEIWMMTTPTKCHRVYPLNTINLRNKVQLPLQQALRLLHKRMTASPAERLRLDIVSHSDEKSFQETAKYIGKKVGTLGKRVNTLISQFEGTIKKLKQFHNVKAETDQLMEGTNGHRSNLNIIY